MLNQYYICDKQLWLDNVELFHPSLGSHYIDLSNGQILVSANFPDNHSSQETFESLPGIVALPHPVFEGAKTLDQEHVNALTTVPVVSNKSAVDRKAVAVATTDTVEPSALDGITATSTVLDVAKAAAAINPLMKLRQF